MNFTIARTSGAALKIDMFFFVSLSLAVYFFVFLTEPVTTILCGGTADTVFLGLQALLALD